MCSPLLLVKALQAAWGDRYRHVKALRNVNYRPPGAPIQLLDANAGIQWAVATLQAGYSPILLCAYRDEEHCHRRAMKELIEKALTAYTPFHTHEVERARQEAGFFLLWEGGRAYDHSTSPSAHDL